MNGGLCGNWWRVRRNEDEGWNSEGYWRGVR